MSSYTITEHGAYTLTMGIRGQRYILRGPFGHPGRSSFSSILVSGTDSERLAHEWREFSGQSGYAATSGHDMEQMLEAARREHEPAPVTLTRHERDLFIKDILPAFIASREAQHQDYSSQADFLPSSAWEEGGEGLGWLEGAMDDACDDIKTVQAILDAMVADKG